MKKHLFFGTRNWLLLLCLLFVSFVGANVVYGQQITSFSPTSGAVSTTVTITGQNFSLSPTRNIVFFGATKAVITGATSTSLTVIVPYGANYQYISVTNLQSNTIGYSTKPFVVTYSSAGMLNEFMPSQDIVVGDRPLEHVNKDFNGDGKTDIIILNRNDNTISILLNITNPGSNSVSFTTITQAMSVGSPYSILAEDLDGDGRLDLIIGNAAGAVNQVYIYKNISVAGGAVSFTYINPPPIPNSLWKVIVTDLDRDGRLDLIAPPILAGSMPVFRNISTSGTITFTSGINFSIPSSVMWGVASDLDGDGKTDLVLSLTTTTNNISIFRNTSTGVGSISFATRIDMAAGGGALYVEAADLNADGRPDIVVPNYVNNRITILRNASTIGNISFVISLSATVPTDPRGVGIGDVNGDGKPDFVTASTPTTFAVSVLLNTTAPGASTFSFAPRKDYDSIIGTTDIDDPIRVNLSDLNNDGKLDISISAEDQDRLSIYLNIQLRPVVITSFSPLSGPISTVVTITGQNFNTTSNRNVVFFGSTQAVVIGATSTSLTVRVPYGTNYRYISVTNLDYNTTGYSAIPFVVTFPNNTGVDLALDTTMPSLGSAPRSVTLADFNGDGKPDLIVANDGNTSISTYRNISLAGGSLSFVLAGNITTSSSRTIGTAVADFDGDGKLDIATSVYVSTSAVGQVQVFRNTTSIGSNAFSFVNSFTASNPANPWGISANDLDGDGRPDLISSNIDFGTRNVISVYRNQSVSGTVSFGIRQDIVSDVSNSDPVWLTVGDLDSDTRPDVVVSSKNVGRCTILKNLSTSGTINLVASITLTGFNATNGTFVNELVDLDGDSKLDIIAADYTLNRLYFFLNKNTVVGSLSFSTTASLTLSTGTNPYYGLDAGDIDGDGKVDIVVGYDGDGTMQVFRNVSTGIGSLSFTKSMLYTTDANPRNLVVGDINSDSRPDVITSNWSGASLSLFRNLATTNVPPVISSFTPESGPISTVVTINGQNFSTVASKNIVFFGATQAVVTSASSSTLTVVVPYGANYQYISLLNLDNNLTCYSSRPFVV